MWLIIILVVVLLLRAIATSKSAANVPMATKTVCSTPSAGDCFLHGNTIAAGVPEPPPILTCEHVTRGPIVYSGLPIHVVYPVAPPPIKITNPAQPAPAQQSPKVAPPPPILSYPKPAPMPVRTPVITPVRISNPIISRPLMQTCFCTVGICGGGYGSGCTSFSTCTPTHGELTSEMPGTGIASF